MDIRRVDQTESKTIYMQDPQGLINKQHFCVDPHLIMNLNLFPSFWTLPSDEAMSTLINIPDGIELAENDQLC